MTDTIRVRPWPGLILAEVPRNRVTELPRALAEEWIANHLVVAVESPAVVVTRKPIRTSVRGSGAPRTRKRRRT